MWGTPDFAGSFAATAMRNRMLAYRAGVRTFKADIVIVDSGFVRAMDAAPFTEDAFTQVTDLLHEQTAPASLGSKRAHGTMVAGLALGGPHLWGMTSSLGLEVKITPATVFDVRTQNGVQTPLFRTQWLLDAIGGDGDIFNISLASKDEAQMNAFSHYIGKGESKLFVVAAGNNNMNNDTRGVDINDTKLFPQRFGGNERGPNLITVAAYDGKGLATFSNYSESYVSIAAPGCAVASWTPNPDNSRYIEQKVTGTSFASPIVAHVAAIVKALMPIRYAQPRYVRARILAGSDLRSDINGVEDGRLLNPIKTISIYEDVLEIEKDGVRRLLFGKISSPLQVSDLCQDQGTPEGNPRLLKFARDPNPSGDKDSILYFIRDGILDNTKKCKRKPTNIVFTPSVGQQDIINLKDVTDLIFRMK
ncbi:S8 family peptidase [Agrobacterium tumefaciens]|nr:S8 family serine peptidase [Agrobacterium tumefaciens]NSY98857.1 S8 family serine peptidase [Agrobacterium tumefaciens]